MEWFRKYFREKIHYKLNSEMKVVASLKPLSYCQMIAFTRMATHSSVLACRIPWTGKPGGLQSMGSQRVGHDWSDLKVRTESEAAQSCPTLRNPTDCSPPGSSIHETFQVRILEWLPLPSPEPRTKISQILYCIKWSRSVMSDSLRPRGL